MKKPEVDFSLLLEEYLLQVLMFILDAASLGIPNSIGFSTSETV